MITQADAEMKRRVMRYYDEFFDPSELISILNGKPFKHREFGYQSFERNPNKENHPYYFSRNMTFNNPVELVDWAAENGPRKFYFGAQYKTPINGSVQRTPWDSTELKFDIDLDAVDDVRRNICSCHGKMMCNNCFELAKEAAVFLIETLHNDFANRKFPCYRDKAVIFLSGSKGLHIHYPEIDRLYNGNDTKKEEELRRFIINYISMVSQPKGDEDSVTILHNKFSSISLERRFLELIVKWFFMKYPVEFIAGLEWHRAGRKNKAGRIFSQSAFAQVAQRIREYLGDPNFTLDKGKIREYGIFYDDVVKNVLLKRYPRYDGPITYDIRRVIKIPNSVDGSTGRIVQKISYDDLWDITLSDMLTIDHFF